MTSPIVSFLSIAACLILAAAVATGCFVSDPCGSGLVEQPNGNCAAPAADASAPVAEAGVTAPDGAAAEASAPTTFGKTCSAQIDCGGDAPICGAPYLTYCTQINCAVGEANANACPSGWTCVSTPGQPSACVKM